MTLSIHQASAPVPIQQRDALSGLLRKGTAFLPDVFFPVTATCAILRAQAAPLAKAGCLGRF